MKQFSKDLGNVSLAPKGKWSREQEYERLALVYNACDNLSYVAKINVPSGVDIENREYWQPMNATGYSDNNFINLTAENENGTITAYESLEEAVATVLPINRRAGATLSFYNLNSDRLDRQAEFELWQFNSTNLANWENKDYWNNIYYNWNVFVGWYIGADALKNHVKLPTIGQYAYVGSNLNDAILYQCRTNGIWTNTGIKIRNYISVVVRGNITIGDNGNWFSDGKDTGIPSTPVVDEQLDNIVLQLQQHNTEIDKLQKQDVVLKSNIDSNFETINNKVDNIKTATDNKIDVADANLQKQITGNDNDIATLNTKHESLSRTVQGIAATGGASTATNVTYNNGTSRLNAENAQDAIDELQSSKFDKTSILQESGESEDKVLSQKAISVELNKKADKEETNRLLAEKANNVAGLSISNAIMPEKDLSYYTQRADDKYYANEIVENVDVIGIFINAAADGKCSIIYVENIDAYSESAPIVTDYDLAKGQNFVPLGKSYKAGGKSQIFVSSSVMLYKSRGVYNRKFFVIQDGAILKQKGNQVAVGYVVRVLDKIYNKPLYKTFSVLGDSISTYKGFIPSGYATFYPNGDVDNVNKTWWKQLENLTGYELLKNASWSGSKVTGTVDDATGKSGCSTKRANDLSEGNIKPDIIIVYFGINNFGSYLGTYDCKSALPSDNALHEFSKAYAKMIHNVITLYNKAKIYCCTLLPRYNSVTESKIDFPNVVNAPDKDGVTIEDYNRYIIEIAKANGCTVINMNETGMNYANFNLYTIDNLHPNTAGHELFAKTIAKVINNDK